MNGATSLHSLRCTSAAQASTAKHLVPQDVPKKNRIKRNSSRSSFKEQIQLEGQRGLAWRGHDIR